MFDIDSHPAPNQRVRLIARGSAGQPLQAPADVVAAHVDGRLELALAHTDDAALTRGAEVTLEYFKRSILTRLQAKVERMQREAKRTQVTLAPPESVRGINRRRFSRVYTAVEASYRRKMETQRRFARVLQLGASGLAMTPEIALKDGEELELALELSDGTLELRGRVVWGDPSRGEHGCFGVELVNQSAEDLRRLVLFVEDLERKQRGGARRGD